MAWHSVWPEGGKSVRGNETFGTDNTTYTEATMNADHHWNISVENDGHHKHVQMIQTGTTAVPVEAVLANGMEGAVYLRNKTATESPTHQSVEPFYINNKVVATPASGTDIMQLLGIRAMAVFTGRTTNGVCVINYSHNMTSVSRTATGKYTALFSVGLPSSNYMIIGGAAATGTPTNHIGVQAGATETVKALAQTLLCSTTNDGRIVDINQGWFICFGG